MDSRLVFLRPLGLRLLAIELINKTAKVTFTWTEWFMAFAPVGLLLLLAVPLLTYFL